MRIFQNRAAARMLAAMSLSIVLGLAAAMPGAAQDQTAPAPETPDVPDVMKVGLYISPPFVMRAENGFTGMAVELWEDITADLDVESEYVVMPTIRELVDAIANGDVDAAVTNLTITKRRAERIDFTHPWYDAGLRIMVSEHSGAGFRALVEGLKESGYLKSYAWIAFVILASTILLTFFDRRFDKDFPRRWRDGVAESFYTVMSVATTGRMSRKNLFGWVGRIWSAIWLVCGVAVLAYVTSTVTSVMTTIALTNQINGVEDLPGRTIGVLNGSTAEEYAKANGLATEAYADIDEAVTALLRGRVDAIVGDAPVLEYYAFTNPDDQVTVVGPIFEPDKYGFGITRNSSLARPLTLEILGANEVDEIEQLKEKYFGDGS